jgi:Fe-S-cluster-containing dehydrogenase component
MPIDRRGFLKVVGLTGAGLALGGTRTAGATEPDVEFYGMLIDTTLCVGCRACEEACHAKNDLPDPEVSLYSDEVFETQRDTSPDAFLVVNRFKNPADPDKPVFVRKQCMHCNQPACASACLVKALEKRKDGAVVYNKDKCMGCRYCMIACPFDIPKFQYDSPTPYIRKCVFCFDRLASGEQPACAESCPEGATLFGKRRDLIEIARERIYKEPDKYVHRIHGEHDVGGTGFMYLSAVPHESIGLRTDLGTTAYPEHVAGFLYAVPLIFVLWPSLLTGMHYLTRNREVDDDE